MAPLKRRSAINRTCENSIHSLRNLRPQKSAGRSLLVLSRAKQSGSKRHLPRASNAVPSPKSEADLSDGQLCDLSRRSLAKVLDLVAEGLTTNPPAGMGRARVAVQLNEANKHNASADPEAARTLRAARTQRCAR